MVRPTRAKTFSEYVTFPIVPFMESQVTNDTQRMDAEWNSGFLKNEDNKKELFSFISRHICKSDVNGTLLLSTYFDGVLTNRNVDVSGLQPCNQAEADTRILLHLANAAVHGHSKACSYGGQRHCCIGAPVLRYTRAIRAVGTGKKYRDIPVHSLHAGLGPSNSIALTLFHSLTGCDTTSQFLGCGKKTAWVVWNSFPDLTDMLVALTLNPNMFGIEAIHMQRIERFVVLMYSKGCGAADVNETTLRLFTSGTKSLESIPPTQAALFQHVKRAILQSSFYWHQALSAQQEIPDFSGWGWQKDNTSTWQLLWTTLDDASVACTTLLHCGCNKACTGRCKCNRAGVRCTALCKCEDGYFNNEGGDD